MPKTVQFTKDHIIRVALDIIRTDGASALTSRSISKRMGCSISPIFRTYANMEELMEDLRRSAEQVLYDYVSDAIYYDPAFKEFGMRLIRFAKEEPRLFHYIFMDVSGRNDVADRIARQCLMQTQSSFGINSQQADYIYGCLWPSVLGYAHLCHKNPDIYTEEYISKALSNHFFAQVLLLKSDKKVDTLEPCLVPSGERVYLRKWRESDAPALFKLASHPELGPRAGWMPHKSVEESLDVIRTFFANNHTWAIILKENGTIVGCAGYHCSDTSNMTINQDEAEVGYWIAADYWNQGLCTEALSLVIEHCKRNRNFSALYGEHFIDNPASGRVMEKCGFTDTDIRKNCPKLQYGSGKEVRVLRLSLPAVAECRD